MFEQKPSKKATLGSPATDGRSGSLASALVEGTRVRGEEQWVRACLQQALPNVEVRLHDDGSRPVMHDFDLMREGRRFAAVEVTAAADAVSLELWKLINCGAR
ncbi:hypothetical protein [Streptomyces niveus]|uniref:hypothetical protein n=1 Tax=Streptomyces niveus TaxID=193462 RepID=UPI0036437856